MWASNLDFRHKPVVIAAVLGLVAIFPLLGLANGLLLFTADTQAARHNIAAPLGLVCRELTKTRNQHAWFPWYADASKQKLTPPKRTMLTPDYHFHAFADHAPLAGKAFTLETPRARCKSAKQGMTIRANIEFGLKPVKYKPNPLLFPDPDAMTKYVMEFDLRAKDGYTEVIASVKNCKNSILSKCSAVPQPTHDVFSLALTEGLQVLAGSLERKSASTPTCTDGSLPRSKSFHPCDKAIATAQPSGPSASLNYMVFLMSASLFSAFLGLAYHFARAHFARFPEQLFPDETWNKMSQSGYGFEKDILGAEHNHLGRWDALSIRNMTICVGGGALAPLTLGLALWQFNDTILGDACHTLNLFHVTPLFCS